VTTTPASPAPHLLAPLRRPAFRRLWLGLAASRLGDHFTTIALLWFVLQLTGSGAALGVIVLCFALPGLVTGPPLGRLLDRHQPRLVMGLDNLARGLVIAAIPALAFAGVLRLWQIAALALLAGALAPASQVGARIVVPQLVPDDELERANALAAVSMQRSYLAGPALAGLVVATVGGPWALLIDAASFLVMAALAFTLPDLPRAAPVERRWDRGNGLGFRPLFRVKEVRIVTLLSLVFFLAYGPLEPALPLYSRETLGAGAAGYGLLWSAFGAGLLAGLLLTTRLVGHGRPGVAFAAIAVLWGLLLAPLAVLDRLGPALLCFALAGAVWAPYSTVELALLQRLVPAAIRGEVFGARATLTGGVAALGPALGGLLLDHLAAPAVIGLSALACVATGLGGLLSPTLRAVRRRGDEHEQRSGRDAGGP